MWTCTVCRCQHTNPTTHHCSKKARYASPQPITSKLATIAMLMDDYTRETNEAQTEIINDLSQQLSTANSTVNRLATNNAALNQELEELGNIVAEQDATIHNHTQHDMQNRIRARRLFLQMNQRISAYQQRLNAMAAQFLQLNETNQTNFVVSRDVEDIPIEVFQPLDIPETIDEVSDEDEMFELPDDIDM